MPLSPLEYLRHMLDETEYLLSERKGKMAKIGEITESDPKTHDIFSKALEYIALSTKWFLSKMPRLTPMWVNYGS
jgi:hypothetical protein